jgi:hypothetical protein
VRTKAAQRRSSWIAYRSAEPSGLPPGCWQHCGQWPTHLPLFSAGPGPSRKREREAARRPGHAGIAAGWTGQPPLGSVPPRGTPVISFEMTCVMSGRGKGRSCQGGHGSWRLWGRGETGEGGGTGIGRPGNGHVSCGLNDDGCEAARRDSEDKRRPSVGRGPVPFFWRHIISLGKLGPRGWFTVHSRSSNARPIPDLAGQAGPWVGWPWNAGLGQSVLVGCINSWTSGAFFSLTMRASRET